MKLVHSNRGTELTTGLQVAISWKAFNTPGVQAHPESSDGIVFVFLSCELSLHQSAPGLSQPSFFLLGRCFFHGTHCPLDEAYPNPQEAPSFAIPSFCSHNAFPQVAPVDSPGLPNVPHRKSSKDLTELTAAGFYLFKALLGNLIN